MKEKTNLDVFLLKEKNLTYFSNNFKNYVTFLPNLSSLIDQISLNIEINEKTISQYISKLKNKKPFLLTSKKETCYNRLSIILNLLSEDFLEQNLDYLFKIDEDFFDFYQKYKK